ncbi:hypothetical protein T4B_6044 [Trichinella pseudospiralis]|uniref:FLYWCH-type domain-containing protein n=1 Tax=Trichinella pseudospiralis TaxID=6337 RepID=A0A0V1JFM9_TRIPS|nr:hypothetical protein T4B_6044 [Trichinella pseudospiralis]KRZ33806.1 hypothetical protein T4B_6044 [Trichinella pseudospiralis]
MEMNEGRVHLLKHTKFEDKQWVCDYVRSGCRGAVYTNLEVSTVLRSTPYSGTCTADEYVLYKIEKRNTLNRRAEEERMYGEECSSARPVWKLLRLNIQKDIQDAGVVRSLETAFDV